MIKNDDQSDLGLIKLFRKQTHMIRFEILDNPILACFLSLNQGFAQDSVTHSD